MKRIYSTSQFNSVYADFICNGHFNEIPEYYPRYRSRYEMLIKQYCHLAASHPLKILDVGGGQLGLLCQKLWGDEACVADIGGSHLDYLQDQGLHVTQWNLCLDQQPFTEEFDFIFFSEVIEHLPIPGHLVLERLKLALKPGGTIICSTPNLYRLRNRVYMVLGKQIYDYFRMPEDQGLGHVIEYSMDHLQWQFKKAGFEDFTVGFYQMHHSPINPIFRIMYWIGAPLFLVPHFRDNLVAVAHAPLP